MPLLNGPAVAQAIQSYRPDLPIIVMSGYLAENVDHQYSGMGRPPSCRSPLPARRWRRP